MISRRVNLSDFGRMAVAGRQASPQSQRGDWRTATVVVKRNGRTLGALRVLRALQIIVGHLQQVGWYDIWSYVQYLVICPSADLTDI